MKRAALVSMMALAIGGCGESSSSSAPPPVATTKPAIATAAAVTTAAPPIIPSPPAAAGNDNPLHLPARKITLDPGRRVFTFPEAMIASAKIGSTLVLYASTVVGFDGDDLVIEGKGGPSYKLSGAYVIPVPDDAKVRVGDAVVTEWSGAMKHAVVTKLEKERTSLRFTDMDTRSPESKIKATQRFIKQIEGLQPGNYAALSIEGVYQHVLLVSAFTEGERKRWFALGFAGAAMLVDEADLKAIPIKYNPKNGAAVWAEWAGRMRRATVTGSDAQGLFTVKFDRASKPASVGWGRLMPPVEGVDPEGKADAGAPP